MIAAPVGFQCPSCVKGAPAVRTIRSLHHDPYISFALIALNVLVFLAGRGDANQTRSLGLDGFDVAHGDWWRIVTSGFIHFDVMHLAFNMLILWWLGRLLEPAIGMVRFGVVYAVALLSGSFAVLVMSPNALTGGASGAVFGLMGATVMVLRRRGIDVMQSGLGGLIVINLLLSFRPGVSIGAHVGGLIGGGVAGAIVAATDRDAQQRWIGTAACLLVGAVVAAASLWVASNPV